MDAIITFNDVPKILTELNKKVDFLLSRSEPQKEDEDRYLTIEELCEYLPEKPARQTVYGWVCNRTIEFEKYGKRLLFKKSTIDKWLANGRRK